MQEQSGKTKKDVNRPPHKMCQSDSRLNPLHTKRQPLIRSQNIPDDELPLHIHIQFFRVCCFSPSIHILHHRLYEVSSTCVGRVLEHTRQTVGLTQQPLCLRNSHSPQCYPKHDYRLLLSVIETAALHTLLSFPPLSALLSSVHPC